MADTNPTPTSRPAKESAPQPTMSHTEDARGTDSQGAVATSTLLQNPLVAMSEDEILENALEFAMHYGLEHHVDDFRKGALMAKAYNTPGGYENITILAEHEKEILRLEDVKRWSQRKMLYFLCALCAGCAIVQGMDQTIINGAQMFYFEEFGITDPTIMGLINGAPYASAAAIGCWLNAPLNRFLGRRGTIFFCCFFAVATAFWQAAASNMASLLAARFVLGLAVGAKSSTTPVYAAECAPKNIRGALTMMWQMWTAFGIMIGLVSSIAFQHADMLGTNTQWRWMFGSTAVPPLIVGACVYFLPESPRWYLDKKRYKDAFMSMRKLRKTDIQAARDLYLAYKYVEVEEKTMAGHNPLFELFSVARNRRAVQSSWFCMLMQQFCGVNVIAYYSTEIFKQAGCSRETALWASFGSGAINWVFAIPAILTIDTFGRRNLLLVTFPAMAVCLFWTGLGFSIKDDQTRFGSLATSIYLFMAIYSPGLGPVPFTYSAEAFPLHIRALGMASATSVTWCFNFLLSFTWPRMMKAFTPAGAFYWYAGWNVFGWVVGYFFLPETKGKTLEELDGVFSKPSRDHAAYYWRRLTYYGQKMLCRDVQPMEPLYPTFSEKQVPAVSTTALSTAETTV